MGSRLNYTNEYFRKNIDFLTSKENITKNALEKKLEMGEGSLSRYCRLNGETPEPKIGILNSIAKVFGVTVDDLINENLEKKEQDILNNNQRKDILFCKKLIRDTKLNLHDWHGLNFYGDGFVKYEEIEGYTIYSNFLDEDGKFKSFYFKKSYKIESLGAYTMMINNDVQVVIIQYYNYEDGDAKDVYELYLIKSDGKVLPSCVSHKYGDGYLYRRLDQVYDMYPLLNDLYTTVNYYVNFGKDHYEKELIYDNYLEIPF